MKDSWKYNCKSYTNSYLVREKARRRRHKFVKKRKLLVHGEASRAGVVSIACLSGLLVWSSPSIAAAHNGSSNCEACILQLHQVLLLFRPLMPRTESTIRKVQRILS